MTAIRTLNLPAGELPVALEVLLAVGTRELEFAHTFELEPAYPGTRPLSTSTRQLATAPVTVKPCLCASR